MSFLSFDEITPHHIFIAYEVYYFKFEDSKILEWVRGSKGITKKIGDLDVAELIRLNNKNPQQLKTVKNRFKQVYKKYWQSELSREDSEKIAKQLFMARLKEYIEENCKPNDLCRMITPIENNYDFPDWLGDMYNSCAWIDDNYESSMCRHLEADARQLLHKLQS